MCRSASSLVAVMVQVLAHRVSYVWVLDEDDDCRLTGIAMFADDEEEDDDALLGAAADSAGGRAGAAALAGEGGEAPELGGGGARAGGWEGMG